MAASLSYWAGQGLSPAGIVPGPAHKEGCLAMQPQVSLFVFAGFPKTGPLFYPFPSPLYASSICLILPSGFARLISEPPLFAVSISAAI